MLPQPPFKITACLLISGLGVGSAAVVRISGGPDCTSPLGSTQQTTYIKQKAVRKIAVGVGQLSSSPCHRYTFDIIKGNSSVSYCTAIN